MHAVYTARAYVDSFNSS